MGIKQKGSFKKTDKFLSRSKKLNYKALLTPFGDEGVRALSASTPVRSGLTANSWYYDIVKTKTGYSLEWLNSNIQNGVKIAIIIQYGHGTRGGAYVQGVDYINPALKPVLERMADTIWREVTK